MHDKIQDKKDLEKYEKYGNYETILVVCKRLSIIKGHLFPIKYIK